ncbi:hypothetical protein ACF05W_33680 [Streptomyces lydicus]|uniref:hypothetical protein n=1 Tax=Streptomyces lydicus TaxID=47763 RepID=UPI0036F67550
MRFQLPGAGMAVSVADPVLLEATEHIDTRPEELFAFLDPLCEAGNLQVSPWNGSCSGHGTGSG